ncbi:MAG: mandelate racemase/muconate lactonizing enzyme family protein [Kofleriaceae bacterium]
MQTTQHPVRYAPALRPDVRFVAHDHQFIRLYEPTMQQFVQLDRLECHLARLMNGQRGLEELTSIARQFKPEVTQEALEQLVMNLNAASLIDHAPVPPAVQPPPPRARPSQPPPPPQLQPSRPIEVERQDLEESTLATPVDAIRPARAMRITNVETFLVDAGWRPWAFVKITTDSGLIGWGECSCTFTQFAVLGAIEDFKPLLVGADPLAHELRFWDLYRRSRLGSIGGAAGKAIGAIECALVDIKARALGVSVAELFGGPLRDRVPLYWSHFAVNRMTGEKWLGKAPIRTLADVARVAREVTELGYRAVKTNLILWNDPPSADYVGFQSGAGNTDGVLTPRRLADAVAQMSAIREVIGPEVELILDVNFNLKPESVVQLLRALEPVNLAWIELDLYDIDALLQIKQATTTPICSLETLFYGEQYRPYFDRHCVDIVMLDTPWNGFVQAKKVGELAQLYQLNVCPHNYYSHLATFISAHLTAVLPNVRIMEFDVDDVPWRDDLVTRSPQIVDGQMLIPTGPGWGTEVNEGELRRRPWGGTGRRSQVTVPSGDGR